MWICQVLLFLFLSSQILAREQPRRRATGSVSRTNVTVEIPTATVIGSIANGVESFAGIPFANPPVKSLRLRPPQRLTKKLGIFDGTKPAKACPQQVQRPQDLALIFNIAEFLPDLAGGFTSTVEESEDCLTVTVTRPEGTKAGDNLPVLFWIYGGAFEIGYSDNDDPSNFLKFGIALNKPFIFVAVNYRVSGFGFLAGKEIQAEGSANLGLLDQRMGLEWVADNIAKFGGNPDQVIIWGISAGSISVLDQLALFNGNHTYSGTRKSLFHGAILGSGSVVPADPVDSKKAQAVYDRVVKAAECDNATSTLQCLRELEYEKFLQAVSSEPGPLAYEGFALSYVPRPDNRTLIESPERLIASGNYAAVPMILGSMEDEGTLASLIQSNLTTTALFAQYLKKFYFWRATNAELTEYINTYGQGFGAMVLGSPYRTGSKNEAFPGYKQRAALIGDAVFALTRRLTLLLASFVNPTVPTWTYLGSFGEGTPYLGTGHGSDGNPIFLGNSTTYAARILRTSFLNFIYSLDPNEAGEAPFWPQWAEDKQQLQIFPNTSHLITDNYRANSFDWIINHLDVIRI